MLYQNEKHMNNKFFYLKSNLFIFLILSFYLLGACGSETSGEGSQSMDKIIEETMPKISQPSSSFSINNFKDIKFKPLKEYKNIEEIQGLKEAWHGVFQKSDYEIRFYNSHEDANNFGVQDANLVTGESGLVTGDVPWEEGAKDRRRCSRPPGQPHSGCNYTSKYGDFIVIGNVILMCEGKDVLESREVCRKLTDFLE